MARVDRIATTATAVLVAAGCLFAAFGCRVGPDHSTPNVPVPDSWSPQAGGPGTAGEPDVAWWEELNDPQLTRYIEAAVEGNRELAVTTARLREARALRAAAAADLWPGLAAVGRYTRTRVSANGPGPISQLAASGLASVDQETFSAGFDASWEIDVFGGTRRSAEAAGARVEAAIERRRDVLVSVVAEVARNYVELRGTQRRREVAERNVAVQEESLRLVERKYEAGRAPELDAVRARGRLERTRASLPPLRAAERAAAFRIAVLLGRTPVALLDELEDTKSLPDAPEMVRLGVPSALLRRRADIRRAERDLHAETAEVGVAIADLYPRFFVLGSGGYESQRFSNLLERNSGLGFIGPRVSWPVFQGGRIRARIGAAQARREAALGRFKADVLHALEEVETAVARYRAARDERDRLAAATGAQRRALELANLLWERGLRDYLTVLDAEEAVTEVEDGLARSETDLRVQLIALYKALGGGWQRFDLRDARSVGSTEPGGHDTP